MEKWTFSLIKWWSFGRCLCFDANHAHQHVNRHNRRWWFANEQFVSPLKWRRSNVSANYSSLKRLRHLWHCAIAAMDAGQTQNTLCNNCFILSPHYVRIVCKIYVHYSAKQNTQKKKTMKKVWRATEENNLLIISIDDGKMASVEAPSACHRCEKICETLFPLHDRNSFVACLWHFAAFRMFENLSIFFLLLFLVVPRRCLSMLSFDIRIFVRCFSTREYNLPRCNGR